MKKITPQNNILKTNSRKKVDSKKKDIHSESFQDKYYEYRHMMTREIMGIDRKQAFALGGLLIKYCRGNCYARIETFHLEEGITPEAWKAMCGFFEELRDAVVLAKNIIGDNRLKLGLEKKYDANLASYALHQYHPDWKQAEDYHDARKAKIGGEQGNQEIHLHMDTIPNSDIVPTKEKE